jgi:tannase
LPFLLLLPIIHFLFSQHTSKIQTLQLVNMRSSLSSALLMALGARGYAATLADVCTVEHIKNSLPTHAEGIKINTDSITANAVYNATSSGSGPGSSSSSEALTYCNVTLSYSHAGKSDTVLLWYTLPAPSAYTNRYLQAGAGAYAIATSSSVTNGVSYGAVTGITDGGFGGWSQSLDSDGVFLAANGSWNYEPVFMFGYQAHGEATTVGKALAANFYNATTNPYTYFQGCSDGGRQAMSQAQRWGDLYDGIIAGAPAFRYGQQQVLHLFPNVVEQTQNYYPPPCELAKIVNLTIAYCDPLDGKTDGVVSRTDLCKLKFDLTSTIGESYYCAAENSTSLGLGYGKKRQLASGSSTQYVPAQNGTVSVEGVKVAQTIIDGLVSDTTGKRGYLSWQIAAEFNEGETSYDSTTDSWILDISGGGGEWVGRFLELQDVTNLESLANVTYDTLIKWMEVGMTRYYDTLQTTYPDLSIFQGHGAKLLHYHGESDPSVPTGSSIH